MVEENPQIPRSNISEDWLIGMLCPVCGNPHLSIERELMQPDRMSCNSCMSLFEISQNGEMIRLVRFPAILPSDLQSKWIKPAAVSRLAYQYARRTEPLIPQPEIDIPLEERVKALARLGNSPDKIREILLRLPGMTFEQVEVALSGYKKQKSEASGWTIALGTAVVLLAFTLVVVLITLPAQPQNENNPEKTSAPQSFLNPANLPAPIQTMIPPGVKILVPTPVSVRQLSLTNEPFVRCPRTPGEAAQVFGGEMKEWTISSDNISGWYLVSMTARSIKVPKNMTAGYFKMTGSPGMESVIGPAMIDNAYFVSISCE